MGIMRYWKSIAFVYVSIDISPCSIVDQLLLWYNSMCFFLLVPFVVWQTWVAWNEKECRDIKVEIIREYVNLWMHGWFVQHKKVICEKNMFSGSVNMGTCVYVFKDLHLIISLWKLSHFAEMKLVQGTYQVLHLIRWNYRSSWESLILSSNPWILRGSSPSFLSEYPLLSLSLHLGAMHRMWIYLFLSLTRHLFFIKSGLFYFNLGVLIFFPGSL